MLEEGAGVLEVITIDRAGQNATGRDGRTGFRDDEREFALRDANHGHFLDMILHDPEAEVESGSECVGLIASFAIEGDDFAGLEVFEREALDDDADLALGNVNAGDEVEGDDAEDWKRDEPVLNGVEKDGFHDVEFKVSGLKFQVGYEAWR